MEAIRKMLEVVYEGEGSHVSIKIDCSVLEVKSDTKVTIFQSFCKSARVLGVLFENKPSFYEKLSLLHIKKVAFDREYQEFGCLISGKIKLLARKKLLLELPGFINNEHGVIHSYIGREKLESILCNLSNSSEGFLNDVAPFKGSFCEVAIISRPGFLEAYIIGQLNKEFIIVSYQESVFAIDQHAIHERILLEQLLAERNQCSYTSSEELENLKTTACKNAIKFGQELSTEKMKNLIRSMSQLKFPTACAHGRISICILIKRLLKDE